MIDRSAWKGMVQVTGCIGVREFFSGFVVILGHVNTNKALPC